VLFSEYAQLQASLKLSWDLIQRRTSVFFGVLAATAVAIGLVPQPSPALRPSRRSQRRPSSVLGLRPVGHLPTHLALPFVTDLTLVDATAVATTFRLAADGDEPAFARLVAEHHAAMARVAYVVTGDAEMTRDAVQAAWSIAWRRLNSVRDPGQVRSWLVAIAANEARHLVGRRRRVTIVDISEVLDRSGGGDPADRIGILDLERVFHKLGPDDRMLLALRFVAGLDSTEIALHLRLSSSGVRSRLARLLERMRADLAPPQGTNS